MRPSGGPGSDKEADDGGNLDEPGLRIESRNAANKVGNVGPGKISFPEALEDLKMPLGEGTKPPAIEDAKNEPGAEGKSNT